ncbi:MAG: AbrB/MazE/SpoVT family DNA-binding domain-containing protein [Nanoarchaeota archaeon]|nr:AbrB/MazE/SpoVT family DNA-binding domain-containing protein [Nanoarchaeota archaeon]
MNKLATPTKRLGKQYVPIPYFSHPNRWNYKLDDKDRLSLPRSIMEVIRARAIYHATMEDGRHEDQLFDGEGRPYAYLVDTDRLETLEEKLELLARSLTAGLTGEGEAHFHFIRDFLEACSHYPHYFNVTIDRQGRILLPRPVKSALALEPGQKVGIRPAEPGNAITGQPDYFILRPV